MRRIVLSFSLIAALALLVILSAVPASAATLSAHHVTSAKAPASFGACYYGPNDTNCNGQDPYTEGCNTISGNPLGGDPWYLKVYYAIDGSNHCQSNWGIAWANPSSQYVQMVWLERFPSSKQPSGEILYYCTSAAIQSAACHQISQEGKLTAVIPNGYHSWHTDMLYAPNASVELCEIWSPNIGNLSGSSSNCSMQH